MNQKKIYTILLILHFLLLTSTLYAQNTETDIAIHEKIQQRTEQIFGRLVNIHRDFHAYPEISQQEKRTSKKIAEYLTSLGLEVHTNIGGYGIVGILKTNKEGKHIAWRADIDAISTDFDDIVSYRSKNEGVRHICGHDINTTIAIGIAEVLSGVKEHLKGTVYFIFQPSEENYRGAKAMIDDGLLNKIDPDEIYASHISPMPEGLIATRPGWLFADYKILEVSYKKSQHKSEIEYTRRILSDLQNINPDSDFWNTAKLSDPNIGLGNPNTIFKDYITVNQNFTVAETDDQLTISTYVSASSEEQMDSILPKLRRTIRASKHFTNLIDVKYSFQRPIINNDEELTVKAIKDLASVYGTDKVFPLYGVIPDGRGDDFAYFQNQLPGVYFLLGGSNFEKGIISMPHSPNFSVDENCIKTGVNVYSSLILQRLKDL